MTEAKELDPAARLTVMDEAIETLRFNVQHLIAEDDKDDALRTMEVARDVMASVAETLASLPRLEALSTAPVALEVKPLIWRKPTDHPKDPDPEDNLFAADGLGGVYAISRRQKVGPNYLLWWADDPMHWTGFSRIDEAKVAAQQDYDKRIRSALA